MIWISLHIRTQALLDAGHALNPWDMRFVQGLIKSQIVWGSQKQQMILDTIELKFYPAPSRP